MIDALTIFEITRLHQLGWSNRKIARKLNIARKTIKRYIENPCRQTVKKPVKEGKLQPYLELIEEHLKQDPQVHATVVLQRLRQQGFTGQITIVRDMLRKIRGSRKKRQAYIRFESQPGQQMQVDWGHFGALSYGDTKRKLYALAVIESYSRMLYVQFTHSQNQQSLHQGLLNAFLFFGGSPKEIVVDNMLTAVVERRGAMIRFNDAFLDFLRTFSITPVACNPGAPYEKGKIESAIKYIRNNFWPLRSFCDLADVQNQVRQWLDSVANARTHHGTGQRPDQRFQEVVLSPLPELLPDCRQVHVLKVHKDFCVRFDGNTYTVPPWTVGKKLTLKADAHTVTLYNQEKRAAVHRRCWQRNCRIESATHTQQVKKLKKRLWHDGQIVAVASIGEQARQYLQGMLDANVPIKKNIARILALKQEYGESAIVAAFEKALSFNAYGAEYIENILYQEMTPHRHHRPVQLKNDDLNRITLTRPCLADYDAHVLKRRKDDD